MRVKNGTVDNRIFFFILLFGIVFLAYITVKPIISLLFLALIITSVFHPTYKWFAEVTGGRTYIAVPTTMLIIFLCIIVPVITIFSISLNQLKIFVTDISEFAGNSEEVQKLFGLQDAEEESDQNTEETENSTINQTDEESTEDTNSQTDDGGVIGENENQVEASAAEDEIQNILNDINKRIFDLPIIQERELIKIKDVKDVLQDATSKTAEFIVGTAINIAENTPIFITNLIVFIIILSSLIPSQNKLKEYLLKLSPLDNKIDELYLKKVAAMSNSMVRGTLVIAVAQGAVNGILFWMADVPYVLFWTLICVFLAFIPNGGSFINWPIIIALLLTGNFVGAAILIVGNLFIVASIDNVLRPMLVSKEASLHPALTLIGVVGGLYTFGFFGFVYGPVIMIFLVTTFDVYINYYKNKDT